MGLANFTPEWVDVQHKDQTLLRVRGLSFDDLSVLIRAHLDSLSRLSDLLKDGSNFATAAFFLDVVNVAPMLAFDTIALAANEPDYASDARKLPVGLQVKILQEISRLTLEDIGGPKVVAAWIGRLVGQNRTAASPTVQ